MSIKIMTDVWDNSVQKGSSLLLLLAIADHAGADGYCWPGVESLAKKIRMSVRTVYRLVDQLETDREVYVVRNQKNNRYIVTLGMTDRQLRNVLRSHGEPTPLCDILSHKKEAVKEVLDPEMSCDNLSCDILEVETTPNVTSHVTQPCHPNHHEPSTNHHEEKEIFSSKPKQGSVAEEPELSDADLFGTSNFTGPSVLPVGPGFLERNKGADIIGLAAASEKAQQERGIWTVPVEGGGISGFEKALEGACTIAQRSTEALGDKTTKQWMRQLRKIGKDSELSGDQLAEAILLLPGLFPWDRNHDQFINPFKKGFIEKVILVGQRIKGGLTPKGEKQSETFSSEDFWEQHRVAG